MSTAGMHVINAQDVILGLIGPGTALPTDDGTTVPEGRVALVIEAQGRPVLVVTGTPQQLRDRVLDGLSLDVPDGVPLVDEDAAL